MYRVRCIVTKVHVAVAAQASSQVGRSAHNAVVWSASATEVAPSHQASFLAAQRVQEWYWNAGARSATAILSAVSQVTASVVAKQLCLLAFKNKSYSSVCVQVAEFEHSLARLRTHRFSVRCASNPTQLLRAVHSCSHSLLPTHKVGESAPMSTADPSQLHSVHPVVPATQRLWQVNSESVGSSVASKCHPATPALAGFLHAFFCFTSKHAELGQTFSMLALDTASFCAQESQSV
mmetsp:Transcript_22414/g.50473  ORF Transcript_22414/g.50473 Transcript_22414/m.50473 type:complete len:235 (-) Transcript_22414:537-1241(-)